MDLNELRQKVAPDPAQAKRQHDRGKYTARERIERLADPGSFVEFDAFVTHQCSAFGMDQKKNLGDGVVTGMATINGRQVALSAQDFTFLGGALGQAHAKKICKMMDLALENRVPVISVNDSGGARIQEGIESLAGYAEIFYRNVKASGIIPQISLIMGPCAGGAVYSAALTDFIFMVEKTSYMFVTGPDVIKKVIHEEITKEQLGGADAHNQKSGVAHFKCSNEDQCFERVRELLHYISPENSRSNDSVARECRIEEIIPENPNLPYDMKEVVQDIVDDGHFFEIHKDFAKNIVVGFAAVGGRKIGVVANQPCVLAGVLDINSSRKAARFIRCCDSFNIPVLTLVDVPGFLPGVDQEHGGIITHGSKLLYAYCEATVPLITLTTRKAYGGAYTVLAPKHIRADVNLGYPGAEIAVMGAEGAVEIIFRQQLAGLAGAKLQKKKAQLVEDYREKFANPRKAAELGYLDEIIFPRESRAKIHQYLNLVVNKQTSSLPRKHGNIQL